MILTGIGIVESREGIVPFSLSGGIVCCYTVGSTNYQSHTFTGSCTMTIGGNLPKLLEIFVQGAGGGGGYTGGGGAGGARTCCSCLPAGDYAIAIGAGGAGVQAYGNRGGNTCIAGFLSSCGGGGGGYVGGVNSVMDGGSGGGGNCSDVGLGIAGQGNNGGLGIWVSRYAGGGGGGASSVGGNYRFANPSTCGGNGGTGICNTFRNNTNCQYAGGGGGSAEGYEVYLSPGCGTFGGGCGLGCTLATSGAINTGGGGGGSIGCTSGSGGSGIVVIRYQR